MARAQRRCPPLILPEAPDHYHEKNEQEMRRLLELHVNRPCIEPTRARNLVFAFGNGKRTVSTTETLGFPVPSAFVAGQIKKWRLRVIPSGSVSLGIAKAATEAAAASALTGTMPSVTAARGASGDVVNGAGDVIDWSDNVIVAGNALEVSIATIGAGVKQVTLVLEVDP